MGCKYIDPLAQSNRSKILTPFWIDNTNTITSCKFSQNQHRITVTSMDRTTRVIDMSMYKDEYTASLTLGYE